MLMNMPGQVSYIIKTLENAGFEAYIVGGCVRDFLLGKSPKDWDITTSALPLETKKLFPHSYNTGIQHGTITVVIDKVNYEVTTYRIDGKYVDFRHPSEVTFTSKIEEDLSRRDFTMNAVAYNEKFGFQDPFDGLGDIKNHVIRAVGDADKRFKEDALRMLRCVRFSAQLDFEIEKKTYDSVLRNSALIKNVSVERIRDELSKLLISPKPEKIIELKKTFLLKEIFPFLEDKIYYGCKITEILRYFQKNGISSVSLLYSALFWDMSEKETFLAMRNLRFDNKTVKETTVIVSYSKNKTESNHYEVRKTLSEIGADVYRMLIDMRKAMFCENFPEFNKVVSAQNMFEEILLKGDCFNIKGLEIDGNVLKKIGVTDGKKIGAILSFCLEEVLKNPLLNTKKRLIEIAREYK